MITVNGDTAAWTLGMTVKDVLTMKNFKFPLLVIKLDGNLIQPKDYITTPVSDGAVVQVIHLMSGG